MSTFLSDKVKIIANACVKGVNAYNIQRPFKERVVMSTKRLQKLIFFCEIEYMKKHNGKPLFEDEYYAWPLGPAVPQIYTKYMLHTDCNGMLRWIDDPNKEEQEIVDYVLNKTAQLDTIELVNACLIEGSPWEKAYDVNDEMHRQVISKMDIYLFYKDRDWI